MRLKIVGKIISVLSASAMAFLVLLQVKLTHDYRKQNIDMGTMINGLPMVLILLAIAFVLGVWLAVRKHNGTGPQ